MHENKLPDYIIAKCWNDINWAKAKKDLAAHQFKILKAYREGNLEKVYKAQYDLTRSFSARSLAVRKVASNQGKTTSGVDNVVLSSPSDKFKAIKIVKNLKKYKAQPVKRVLIPKTNGTLRPLGIPTIKDRIIQTLFMFALNPIAEETSDSRSYGFRSFRGTNDNMIYLKLVLGSYTATRRYILDADIEGFFDSVGHDWLMKNIPMNKKILNEFLSAGFVDGDVFHNTNLGFPQGSPISPVLANMTLDGLQEYIGKEFLYTRYADDFIVLGKSETNLKKFAIPLITKFLNRRGLRLNSSKTKIVEIVKGFNFLGYNFREYPDVSRAKGRKKGILLVKPAKKNIKKLKQDITKMVRDHRQKPILALIQKLNLKLRGWAEYYRTVTSQKAFSSISYHIWKVCWAMLRKKHCKRNATWIVNNYFTKKDGNKWILCSKHKGMNENEITLFQIAYVEIKRHSLCINLNPYDPENYAYFEKRKIAGSKISLILGRIRSKLLKKQRGSCPVCKMTLLNKEELEVHHAEPKRIGGTDKPTNLRLLHKECHKQITTSKNKNLLATWKSENII